MNFYRLGSEPLKLNLRSLWTLMSVAVLMHAVLPVAAWAQEPVGEPTEPVAATPDDQAAQATPAAAANDPANPSIWDMAIAGGLFMVPIAICSVVVIAFTIERLFGLRAEKVIPSRFQLELKKLGSLEKGFDPQAAYKLCQRFRSPLANAVRAALLKTGRPQTEVEKTVEDAVTREATSLSKNIRPINVCATITPLLGLIGTVQGMILAFMVTSTTTSTGSEKAQELAQGIYTALVTTFAGLCVAVTAVLCANYLEGKIDALLARMEEIFEEFLQKLQHHEGRVKITRTLDVEGSEDAKLSEISGINLHKAAALQAAKTQKRQSTSQSSASQPAAAPAKPSKSDKAKSRKAAPVASASEGEEGKPKKGLFALMGNQEET
ncbi:MAG: hypothetical protein CMJ78_02460 [Planctomycetaceae bacterium]|nr:hypothetical protein [Planctomycetaceae bacterium]